MSRTGITHTCLMLLLCLLGSAVVALGADPKPTRTSTEVAELRRLIDEQNARIAELTRKVERLETDLAASRSRPIVPRAQVTPRRTVQLPGAPLTPEGVGADAYAGAKRVVFILDTSGSMIDKFTAAKAFITTEVAAMPAGSTFNVLSVGDENVSSLLPQPLPATPRTVAEFQRALDTLVTSGTSNLMPAVLAALKQRADVVWLVTDGDVPKVEDFLTQVRGANQGRQARIHTVAVQNGPNDEAVPFGQFLKTLASQNRGIFCQLITLGDDTRLVRDPAAKPPEQPVVARAAASNKRIVFVIDVSGAMTDRLALVKEEVRKAVAGLPPEMKFNICASSSNRSARFKDQPVLPTPGLVAEFNRFLDLLTTGGKGDVMASVESAMQQQPDVMWIVTNGDIQSGDELRDRIRDMNRDGHTRVNTVVAGDTKRPITPETARWVKYLAELASANGGRCIDLTGAPVDVTALNVTQPGSPDAPKNATAETPPAKPAKRSVLFDEL